MSSSHDEARRLLSLGFKLCELKPMTKQPEGDAWNQHLLTRPEQVRANAGGFGMPLHANGMCSVDFDNVLVAERALRELGFDPEWIRDSGVATSSTRPGSGGRVAFRVPVGSGLRWLRFTNKTDGTILELRATSPNLQDCLPGTTYLSQDGSGPWVQDYSGLFTFDCAPELPAELWAWWGRMSEDLDFLHEQQRLIAGESAQLDVSSGSTLAYASPYRMSFNEREDVEEILVRHGYEGRNRRYRPPTGTGAPGVRPIPGKDGLWRSDHASDALFGTFDAWTAHVVLDNNADLNAAERAAERSRSVAVLEGFDELQVAVRQPQVEMGQVDDLGLPTYDDEVDELPVFERDKQGKVKATINNLLAALRCPQACGVNIGWDGFRDEIMLAEKGSQMWRPFRDADYVTIRSRLESGACGFLPIGREMVRDVVLLVAEENKFDSAIMWLKSQKWDGVQRIDRFFPALFGVENTPYARAVGAYLWTAMAGRVLDPGCQADMVPILVGAQGLGKSSAVAALVPSPEFFAEVSFTEKDDDLSRKMRGKLVAEIGELRGLHSREMESVKAFVTRRHEQWVPKFREFATIFPRRLVFIGSTNKDQFLADDTGNRRWLPIRVGAVDVDKVRLAAAQCWAEGAARFLQNGVEWRNAQKLAESEHDEFAFHDEWEEKVLAYLADPLFDEGRTVRTSDVLQGAIGIDLKQVRRSDEMRMGSLLRKLGYERKRVRLGSSLSWRYVPPLSTNVPA